MNFNCLKITKGFCFYVQSKLVTCLKKANCHAFLVFYFIYFKIHEWKIYCLKNILKCINLSIPGYLSLALLFSHSRVICLIQLFVYQILFTCFHLSFFPHCFCFLLYFFVLVVWLFFFQFKQPLLFHWMWVSEQVWMKGNIFFKTVLHLAKMFLGG